MKKIILTLLIVSSFSFADTNRLKVEGSLTEWNKHYEKLRAIRQIVDNSNMNNQEVKFITKTIDSLEMFIVPQLQKQLADTTKKR